MQAMSPGMEMTAMGGIIILFWLFLMIGMVAGWVIFLVAVWRGMKAHESVAESLRKIAAKQV